MASRATAMGLLSSAPKTWPRSEIGAKQAGEVAPSTFSHAIAARGPAGVPPTAAIEVALPFSPPGLTRLGPDGLARLTAVSGE